MAGCVCVDSQLSNHVVNHLIHPFTPEALEVVEKIVFVVSWAFLLAEFHLDIKIKDDLLVHFRSIIVVFHEDVTDLRAANCVDLGGEECEGEKDKENSTARGNHFVC